MQANTISADLLSKMFITGAMNLAANKEYINELNVFPVPDGDTGTNMTLTIMSAAREVNALENPGMETLCKAISSGSLRGARGNSGVILSQLLRGFTKVCKEYDELDVPIISSAFDKAVETAFKAVMKPKEGTILTVARGACEKADKLYNEGVTDLGEFFGAIVEEAEVVLSKTPDMLPVLKEAGVVDSGGQGLLEVLKGAYNAFKGNAIEFSEESKSESKDAVSVAGKTEVQADIKYGYCTEFIILLDGKSFNMKNEKDLKDYLEGIGDSIVVVADEDVVKVHVHTNDPGLAIQRALKYGQLSNLKIDNMRLENKERNEKAAEANNNQPRKEVGFIAVSVGEGIGNVFKNLGADYLIEGGQTMNPSTEDMLNAIDKVNADTIFIFPNNKNIIMAANQARDIAEDKRIIVIPTKTVPQGITALISYLPESTVEENQDTMLASIGMVKTGQVTYAVRDTVIDGVEIHKDDYMGIGDSGILDNGGDINNVTLNMVDKMTDADTELISIYYGADVKEADAVVIRDMIAEKYPKCDIDMQFGGQPIYYYIISAE